MRRVTSLFHIQRLFPYRKKSLNVTDKCLVNLYLSKNPEVLVATSFCCTSCRIPIQEVWGCSIRGKACAISTNNGRSMDAKRAISFQAVLHVKEKQNEKGKDVSQNFPEVSADRTVHAEPKRENILTVPNLLTMSRIVATPWLGYLVVHDQFSLALGVFVVAGFTDMLDGYIARNFKNQQTVCGSFLDPLADKFLVSVLTISLTVAGLIPVPLTTLIVLRDTLLVAGAFYIRYLSIPPPKTLARYFDVTYATATLHPSTLSKINTILQLSLVAASIAAPVFGYVDHILLKVLWFITGGTTLGSGIQYAVQRNQYFSILHRKMKRRI